MTEFSIPNMSCGHCAGVITRAVKVIDPHADVQIELQRHLVRIRSSADRETLVEALANAGYRPQ